MKATHCTKEDLERALSLTSNRYENNVVFRDIVPNCKSIRFTLTVKDCKLAGHRRSFPLRNWQTGEITKEAKRLRSACWHVHGTFFDFLFKVNPDAVIYSQGKKITAQAGNWEDRNIGSMVFPMYFSEACDCQ